MARFKNVVTPDGQTQVEITGDELEEIEARETAWANGSGARAMRRLREQRDNRLAETDWWASSDLTMTDEQTAYRQSLRDFPGTADIDNIVWPNKPMGDGK